MLHLLRMNFPSAKTQSVDPNVKRLNLTRMYDISALMQKLASSNHSFRHKKILIKQW